MISATKRLKYLHDELRYRRINKLPIDLEEFRAKKRALEKELKQQGGHRKKDYEDSG